jgi:hypothetical protein
VILVAASGASCSPHRATGAPQPRWRVSPAFGSGVFVAGVMADPWMAVGSTGAAGDLPATACFRSTDGLAWSKCALVPIDTDGAHTRLVSVARVGPTVVAGGVAVGALHGNPRPYLWAGPPGGPLTELNLPRELFGGERIIAFASLTAGPLGGVAAGTWDGVTHQSVAQVWRSADGMDWKRLDGIASLTSSTEEILRGNAAAVGARRAVLVGTAFNLHHLGDGDDGAIWWSDDTVSWVRADLAGAGMAGPGDQELRVAAVVDGSPDSGAFLVGGSSGGAATIWTSDDGRQWRRADPLPGGTGRGATVTAVAVGPVAGAAPGGAGDRAGAPTRRRWAAGVVDGRPKLWSSFDGRVWDAVTLPEAALSGAGPAQLALVAAPGPVLVVVQGALGSLAVFAPG